MSVDEAVLILSSNCRLSIMRDGVRLPVHYVFLSQTSEVIRALFYRPGIFPQRRTRAKLSRPSVLFLGTRRPDVGRRWSGGCEPIGLD